MSMYCININILEREKGEIYELYLRERERVCKL